MRNAKYGSDMKTALPQLGRRPAHRRGFTLIEACFAMMMVAVMFLALYDGLTYGFTLIKLARENTRATQILVEKTETIRLYTWDQINSNGFILKTFTNYYYPIDAASRGTVYTGTLTVTNTPLTTSYAGDMKKILVTLNWKTGGLSRTRSLSTYVSRYGLQNYIYY